MDVFHIREHGQSAFDISKRGSAMSQSKNHQSLFPGQSLDPKIQRLFTPMCQVLPNHALPQLKRQMAQNIEEMQLALAQNEFLDVSTAQSIEKNLCHLLETYPKREDAQKALIVGAVKYFIRNDDAEHDTNSILGLDDDVAVLNYVLDQLELPQLKIHL